MANFPNKIFSLKESSLFYMLEIKKHLSKNDFDVWVLYNIIEIRKHTCRVSVIEISYT